MNKTKKLTYVTMLTALAIVINVAENAFLPSLPLGSRFGLANIIALITINRCDNGEMVTVNIMRVILANLLTGTIFGTKFFIAIGGVILSSVSLIITKKLKCTILFSSIISALCHMAGQMLVVSFIYGTLMMFTAFPLYIISAVGTGILTGIIASEVLKRVKI